MVNIRFRYVVEDVDRHGNVRLYFRRKGQRKIRLSGTPGSEEFMEIYKKALSGSVPAATKRSPQRSNASHGSLRWICQEYYKSAEFRQLDLRTQRVRRNILEDLCRDNGDKPVSRMEPRYVRMLRDERSNRPEAANALLKAIRQVFAYGIAIDIVFRNPAKEVPYLHSGSQGFHSWTPDEITTFEKHHAIGTTARLAFGLLLYTGQRRSDVVQFGRQHVRNSWLKFIQHKNRKKRPVTLEIPLIAELQRVIDGSPCGDLTFLVTKFGGPFTANGFGNKFRQWCNEAGLSHCSAHGLRKAAAARLAELGATEHEIMAVTGHRTSKEVIRYTQAARQKVLAGRAMARLITADIENKSVPLDSVVQKSGTKSKAK
jgi:integrase